MIQYNKGLLLCHYATLNERNLNIERGMAVVMIKPTCLEVVLTLWVWSGSQLMLQFSVLSHVESGGLNVGYNPILKR